MGRLSVVALCGLMFICTPNLFRQLVLILHGLRAAALLSAFARLAVPAGIALSTLIEPGFLYAGEAGFVLKPDEGKAYVTAEGRYDEHLQGITTNGTDAIYWSFTTKVIKTDTSGKLLKTTPEVIDHHGDLTFANGKVYIAVNDRTTKHPGQFNYPNPNNPARQWIYEYDADLHFITRHAVPQAIYGAGGVAFHDNRFWVVGGLPGPWLGGFDPEVYNKNFVYEYDSSFRHLRTHELLTGNTDRGIQTIEFGCGKCWLGTYETKLRRRDGGTPSITRRQVYVFDKNLSLPYTRFAFKSDQSTGPHPDGSMGITALPNGCFLVGGDGVSGGSRVGYIWMARVNREGQLTILETIPNTAELSGKSYDDLLGKTANDVPAGRKTDRRTVRVAH